MTAAERPTARTPRAGRHPFARTPRAGRRPSARTPGAGRRLPVALIAAGLVLLNAAIQAALVAIAPPLALSPFGLLTAAASALALLAGAAALWLLPHRQVALTAAIGASTPTAAPTPTTSAASTPTTAATAVPTAIPTPAATAVSAAVRIAWVVGSGVVCGLVGVAAPYLLPLAVAVACWFTAAAGFRPAGRLVAHHPIRFALLTLLTILSVVLAALAALLLGLFVTGWPAAATTWLLAGTAAALLVPAWRRLAARPRLRA